jgi:hypothetical protein
VEAVAELVQTFGAFRADPWIDSGVMRESMRLARELGKGQAGLAAPLFDALREPFVLEALQQERLLVAADLLEGPDIQDRCLALVNAVEPYPLWDETWLRLRHRCFAAHGDARAAEALSDLRAFRRAEPLPFDVDLASAPARTLGP